MTSFVHARYNNEGSEQILDPNMENGNVDIANKVEAKDGLDNTVTSTPLSVAQQIASTFPPNCTIAAIGTGNMPGLTSGTAGDSGTAPGKLAGTNINIDAVSASGDLVFIGTMVVRMTNTTTDPDFGCGVGLYYYDLATDTYINNGGTKFLFVASSATAGLRNDQSVTFACVFPASQRRTDLNPTRWVIVPYVQSTGGGSWQVTQGSYLSIEVETKDSMSIVDSIEELLQFSTYGQSLASGRDSIPTKTLTAVRPGRAVMPVVGVRPLGVQNSAASNALMQPYQIKSLVDLKEATIGTAGETPSSAAMYQITGSNGLPSYQGVAIVNNSIGGLPLQNLSSGTLPYQNVIASVKRVRALCRRNGIKHKAAAMFLTQGESNKADTKEVYLGRLLSFQASISAEIRAIDRGDGEFPIFIDQVHNWTSDNVTESAVPFAQLQAALDYPGKFYLTCPKYMLQTVVDGTHLTADSSPWLGAYQGEIARRVFVEKEQWLPTYIKSAIRIGNKVILTYNVPNGPLVVDTTLVSDPGNYGFRFIQTGGDAVTITGVAITGKDQVTITLSAIPTGTDQKIGYADIGISGNGGGPLTGPRGNIRDSAPAVGLYGETLYNWAAVQSKDIVG